MEVKAYKVPTYNRMLDLSLEGVEGTVLVEILPLMQKLLKDTLTFFYVGVGQL